MNQDTAPGARAKKRIFIPAFFVLMITYILAGAGAGLAAPVSEDGGSWFVDQKRFKQSAHGHLNCQDCHGTMKEEGKIHPDPKDPQFLKGDPARNYDYHRCASCHRISYERYNRGAHARALAKERQERVQGKPAEAIKRAPSCGDCHGSHYEPSHLSRWEAGRKMTETCGSCHPAQKMTYLENYHGKAAVNLGNTKAAYCSDCHGAHECLSLKDKKAALAACLGCHPQAREKFAQMVIHPTTRDLTEKDREKKARVALIKTVALIMTVLVILVVAFFYGHTFLWILRELNHHLRKKPK
jgi:hypothetical protein